MSFERIAIDFIKETQSIFLYGGEMVVSLRHRDGHGDNVIRNYALGQYILTGIDHDLDRARVTAIDFRYFLNAKYPTETFERGRYPFLEDRHVGNVMPEMIGHGNGIPGVCLNGLQIYHETEPFPAKIERYEYRFPPGFSVDNLFKIEIKMSGNAPLENNAAVFDDTWVEVFPGLGNPNLRDNEGGSLFAYQGTNPLLTVAHINSATGIVRVHWRQALKNSQWGNEPNEIRMYARWPNRTMFQAMRQLLRFTGNVDIANGMSGEFTGLAEVGLFLNESRSIFEWVERLQSSNIIGGQLFTIGGALRFRLENPNRNVRLEIPVTDVINHEELPVGVAEEFMYSGWDIKWTKSHADGNESGMMGNNIRYPTAPILNGEDMTTRYFRQVNPARIGIVMMRTGNVSQALVTEADPSRLHVEFPRNGFWFSGEHNTSFSFPAGAARSETVWLTGPNTRLITNPPIALGRVPTIQNYPKKGRIGRSLSVFAGVFDLMSQLFA